MKGFLPAAAVTWVAAHARLRTHRKSRHIFSPLLTQMQKKTGVKLIDGSAHVSQTGPDRCGALVPTQLNHYLSSFVCTMGKKNNTVVTTQEWPRGPELLSRFEQKCLPYEKKKKHISEAA